MKFSICMTAFVAGALAVPTELASKMSSTDHPALCPTGLYSNAECCATDVLGVADLDCKPRKLFFLFFFFSDPPPPQLPRYSIMC